MTTLLPQAFIFGSVGAGELLVVFGVALVLFGPGSLPRFARSLGRIADRLQRAAREFRAQLMAVDSPGEPGAPGGAEDGKPDDRAG